MIYVRGSDGRAYSEEPYFDMMLERNGFEYLTMERRDFLRIIFEQHPDKNRILTGKRVLDYEEDNSGVTVKLEDGTEERGDILIGCDGVHSTVRSLMWKHANTAIPGYITAEEKTSLVTSYKSLVGVAKPVPGVDKTFFFVNWKLPQKKRWPHKGKWSDEEAEQAAISVADVPITDTVVFGELWKNKTRAHLIGLEEGTFDHWHFGRAVLAGDSVHKVTPNLALGAMCAMESCAVLLNEMQIGFPDMSSGENPSQAAIFRVFERYEAQRRRRQMEASAASAQLTRLQAWDGMWRRLSMRWLIPAMGQVHIANLMAEMISDSPKINFLPITYKKTATYRWKDEPTHVPVRAKQGASSYIIKGHAERKLQESACSGQTTESRMLSHSSDNTSEFVHNEDVSMSELGALAVELGFTTAEDPALYAIDQRMLDDFASAFPSVSTLPGPMLDDFGISSEETVLNNPNPINQHFMQPSSSVDEADGPSGAAIPGPGTFQIPPDTYHRLVDAYFEVIQQHLPLINQKGFVSTPIACLKHQVQALQFSVCMAGAHACDDLRDLELQCYIAARWYLEQAELEVQGSSVCTLEAAQALVLVLRFDRLDDTWSHPSPPERSDQSPPPPQLEDWRRTCLISLSLRHRITSICPPHTVEDEQEGNGSSQLQLGDNVPQKLATARQTQLEAFDPFSLFCFSIRLAAETDRHQRLTIAEAEDSAPPSFNFCRFHSRLELEIGALISTLTTSSPGSAISSGLDSDLRVLAILTALGARIQLIKTTILHGRNAKFLEPIFVDCHKQNISTAEDFGEVLAQANVLDTVRIRAFREAGLYIMPPLALAAEALLLSVQKLTVDGECRTRPRTREIRQSLDIIYKVMSACKDDTARYDSCIARSRAALENMQLEMQFRTDFSSFALASDTSPPQRGKSG
ncbi:Zeaxanthin epoxidase, chloroplastic [Cytospora mali]|uniref:Zeaxanthin epoxidase, chloroplastic n=1 Tax=Cytospora mali TaxID=578113 RepID=A0A194VCF6_CYTMA|nr:Zeaxanthin epoxidase, chloroplastic [Valsa mali var. pyri (nom. inval.)]